MNDIPGPDITRMLKTLRVGCGHKHFGPDFSLGSDDSSSQAITHALIPDPVAKPSGSSGNHQPYRLIPGAAPPRSRRKRSKGIDTRNKEHQSQVESPTTLSQPHPIEIETSDGPIIRLPRSLLAEYSHFIADLPDLGLTPPSDGTDILRLSLPSATSSGMRYTYHYLQSLELAQKSAPALNYRLKGSEERATLIADFTTSDLDLIIDLYTIGDAYMVPVLIEHLIASADAVLLSRPWVAWTISALVRDGARVSADMEEALPDRIKDVSAERRTLFGQRLSAGLAEMPESQKRWADRFAKPLGEASTTGSFGHDFLLDLWDGLKAAKRTWACPVPSHGALTLAVTLDRGVFHAALGVYEEEMKCLERIGQRLK